MRKKRNKLFPAVATLTGTIIGAGFLGIPYAVAKTGFFIGLAYIVLLCFVMLMINLYLGEIALRTKGEHQLPGYAKRYLGVFGRVLMLFSMIFGIYSALIAYMLGEGESLSMIFFANTNHGFAFSLVFWLFMSLLIARGFRTMKKGESIGLVLVLFMLLSIVVYYGPKIELSRIMYSSAKQVFMPLGVILFSFLGFSAMPELERVLHGQESLMKKAIIIGMLIPLAVYTIFTFVVLGYAGKSVSEIATLSLARIFVFLGVITMFTAFFALSIALRDMYMFDFGMRKKKATLLVITPPLLIFLALKKFGLASFSQLLALAGNISGSITGLLVLLMIIRAKKLGNRKPEYSMPVSWPLLALLLLIFLVAVSSKFIFS